jgi:putative DNA methylase
MPTKLIEVSLPVGRISRAAQAEAANPFLAGHPRSLKWWARRPLTACRAVLFAQLADDPSAHPDLFPTEEDQAKERQRLFEIIESLVASETAPSLAALKDAESTIADAYPCGPAVIVDPFCGGGSIPLEAIRLGQSVEASDLNPVAVMLTKAVTVPPPLTKADLQTFSHISEPGRLTLTEESDPWHVLAQHLQLAAAAIEQQVERDIGSGYPIKVDVPGAVGGPTFWFCARTVICPNPACRASAPLLKSFCLSRQPGRSAWLRPVVQPTLASVRFGISGELESDQDGSVNSKGARCLVCKVPIDFAHIRKEGVAGRLGTQVVAIAADVNRRRTYLAASEDQVLAGQVPLPGDVPETDLPDHALGFRVQAYGLKRHADLFSPRQLNLLSALASQIRAYRQLALTQGFSVAYADSLSFYLALGLGRVVMFHNSLCKWNVTNENVKNPFGMQTLSMTWDFVEANPFRSALSFGAQVRILCEILTRLPSPHDGQQVSVTQSDARHGPSTTNAVVLTDPPYYDNVGYSDLSDFFYIWLRLALAGSSLALLQTVLTPKADELISDPGRFGGRAASNSRYENGFRDVFSRLHAAHRSDTPLAFFYAFRQSETAGDGLVASTGWEKMLEGVLAADWSVVGTWPILTERAARPRGLGSNALASSVVVVCRPRDVNALVTDRRDLLQRMRSRLAHDLRILQSGGIAPVDLAQAAIGPGMAVFSSYAKVIEPDGSPMQVRTALALINQILDEVTAEQEGEFDEATRWAIAWYAEQGVDEGSYGRADDLSRAKNVSVDGLVRAGLVKAGGGKVRLLEREELDPDCDPSTDSRVTVWEFTQHLIRRLLTEGEASAAELLAKAGGLGDAARDLSYRLFQIAESKKWAKEAGPYNALAASWLEMSRLAAMGPDRQAPLPGLEVDGSQ